MIVNFAYSLNYANMNELRNVLKYFFFVTDESLSKSAHFMNLILNTEFLKRKCCHKIKS